MDSASNNIQCAIKSNLKYEFIPKLVALPHIIRQSVASKQNLSNY